ncbi:methyl-accepting chemotaxis protein [Rhodoferax sp.]|uniref:methyl-accepting chemotaxis protein n=1 Tax=Rhodoferax sp. TaxID=50421 RepID=UPI00260EF50E|nr:methyl-accepting chemotaxis protein [Rhodoferax sp.]MDD2808620.1 methyl-accepting chemotaxis protein [Rhodoferax sp.]MDD4942107.1 methyl-accepting chemotaxis protein [Rhodoferax sp.]
MKLNNLPIGSRLLLLMGILATALLLVGSLGLYGTYRSNAALQTVYLDRTVPIGQLAEIDYQGLRNRYETAAALADPTPERLKATLAVLQTNTEAIARIWAQYMQTYLTPEEAQLAKRFDTHYASYLQQGVEPLQQALRAGDLELAKRVLLKHMGPAFKLAHADLTDLINLQKQVAKAEFDTATAHFQVQTTVSVGSIVLSMGLALWLGWLLAQSITQPLSRVVQVSDAMAQGDLTHTLAPAGTDEVGALVQAVGHMGHNLTALVTQVRQGSEAVASASAQIAQGNHDLSSRTESQASALEQTAASMEQLSATVKHTADSAAQANNLAINASSVAVYSGELMTQVVQTMHHINDSARRIFDIIGVIDSIAFQTNILALNAAVEAARAGDEGRGFAVVAAEVRALAGRSAAAAKEIKTLIGASVERVEQGSRQVDDVGKQMTEVVNAVLQVTEFIASISAASRQQSTGVAQVSEAVVQMDHNTQQNAALVEQMAAAASSLNQQAQDLVQAVAVFKLSAVPGRVSDSRALALRPVN